MTIRFFLPVCCASLVLSGASASAQIVGQLWQNEPGAAGNATIAQAALLGTPDAKFNPAAIAFDSRISGYTLNEFLHFPVFYATQPGFDPNAISNDTYYLFTGQLFLNAGANNFVIPHDDGLQLNISGIGMVVDQAGPTAPVETPFVVNAPADGLYDFTLSYGECCGAPGVLGFKINGAPVGNVPDGGATLAMLGVGLAGLAGMRLRARH
jgi:hypothetical protein